MKGVWKDMLSVSRLNHLIERLNITIVFPSFGTVPSSLYLLVVNGQIVNFIMWNDSDYHLHAYNWKQNYLNNNESYWTKANILLKFSGKSSIFAEICAQIFGRSNEFKFYAQIFWAQINCAQYNGTQIFSRPMPFCAEGAKRHWYG